MAGPPTQNKLYRTFTKGLVTEAGFLTYPENASTDESNTVIKVKGSRSRRFGLDWEPNSVGSALPGISNVNDIMYNYSWRSINNDAETNFQVLQDQGTLYFFDMDASPTDGSLKTFTVDITQFVAPFATVPEVESTQVDMTSGKGFLFVVSPVIEPFYVVYDPVAVTMTPTQITIMMRDFDGINDSLGVEEQPATLSKEHLYNLRNQGWVTPSAAGVIGGNPTWSYTAPTPPATTTPQYIDPYSGKSKFYGSDIYG